MNFEVILLVKKDPYNIFTSLSIIKSTKLFFFKVIIKDKSWLSPHP